MEIVNTILEFEILRIGDYTIRVYTLVAIAMIIAITKMVLNLIKKALFRRQKLDKLDVGNAYALYQIIKYVVWVIAIGFLLETIGIKVTVLIAGSAALLVGGGLGLQQTFNDVFSTNTFRIGKVKSDIRRIINKKFIANNITIPFPQMDLHVKSIPNMSHVNQEPNSSRRDGI